MLPVGRHTAPRQLAKREGLLNKQLAEVLDEPGVNTVLAGRGQSVMELGIEYHPFLRIAARVQRIKQGAEPRDICVCPTFRGEPSAGNLQE